jgi:hypothetical protein
MRLSRITTILCLMTLSAVSFLPYSVISQTNEIENIVNAEFNIKILSATDLEIKISLDPQRLTLDKAYTSEQIKSANQSDLGAFGYLLFLSLKTQLNTIFKDAEIKNFSRPEYNKNTFTFTEFLEVELTSQFFGLNEEVASTHSFLNGILDMSGYIDYNINLAAESGWNNTFKISFDSSLDFQKTTGTVSGSNIIWTLKNWQGESPSAKAYFQLKKKSPSFTSNIQDIFLEFIIDSTDDKNPALITDIIITSVDISKYNILPTFISNLNFISSDGVRLFVENGFFTWDEIYITTLKPIENNIKTSIESSKFNQSLNFVFNWYSETASECTNPYDISNMDSEPTLKAYLKDEDINLKIFDISSRAIFGLINAGAQVNILKTDINFGENLNSIGNQYNVTLSLPNNIYLSGKNIYTWHENTTELGQFESGNSKTYDKQQKEIVIEIEVTSADLNLLSFFTANTELSFGLALKKTKNLNVISLPNEFNLPEKVQMDYLNSDAIRLCIQENVFKEQEVNEFLNNEKELFENILKYIIPDLEVLASINKNIFSKSLQWDEEISNMDESNPVVLSSSAHSLYPIKFDFSLVPPSVDIPAKTLNFIGIQDSDVTYKIIFPSGIKIEASDTLNKSIVGELKDGRYYLEVTFSSSEGNLNSVVSCKMIPSALFIIGVFLPCIISFFIIIILIILVIVIRRKRKGKKPSIPEYKEEDESAGFEDEDYYIPPPPSK